MRNNQDGLAKFQHFLSFSFYCDFLEEKELDFMFLDAIEKKLSSQLLSFQKIGVAFAIRYEIEVLFYESTHKVKSFDSSHGGRCMIGM